MDKFLVRRPVDEALDRPFHHTGKDFGQAGCIDSITSAGTAWFDMVQEHQILARVPLKGASVASLLTTTMPLTNRIGG